MVTYFLWGALTCIIWLSGFKYAYEKGEVLAFFWHLFGYLPVGFILLEIFALVGLEVNFPDDTFLSIHTPTHFSSSSS